MIVGVVVLIVIIGLAAVFLTSSSGSLPTSKTVFVDGPISSCKESTVAYNCTIVLEAKTGTITVSDIKSVSVNGTSIQPTITASGSTVTIVAPLPSATPPCVSGCPPNDAANSIPKAGAVVVVLTDGTQVTALLGAGGILQ
jgi:hypothetical protein